MGADLREVVSKRYALLQALADGAKSKPELAAAIQHSRSTVDRAVRELLDAACIEPTAAGKRTYQLTPAGRIAVELEATHRDRTDRLGEYRELMNSVPADAPVSDALISEAEVYYSPRTPDIAFQPGTEILSEANKMMGTAPVVREEYFETLRPHLESGGFELEIVMDAGLLAAIKANYETEFTDLTERDAVTVYVTEQSLPYALWLTEQDNGATAGITIHDDGGVKGSIVNESPSAIRWAKAQYTAYRDAATRVK